jgi:hypothetical protein
LVQVFLLAETFLSGTPMAHSVPAVTTTSPNGFFPKSLQLAQRSRSLPVFPRPQKWPPTINFGPNSGDFFAAAGILVLFFNQRLAVNKMTRNGGHSVQDPPAGLY